MASKLRDYQVIDVTCGGALYKVSHKSTKELFTWKAYSCSTFSTEELQRINTEVKLISELQDPSLLRYHDTILHMPSKTLYFIREYNAWKSLDEIITICKETDRIFSESYIWFLLHEVSRLCKVIQELNIEVLSRNLNIENIFMSDNGLLKVNFFDLNETTGSWNMFKEIGEVISAICNIHLDVAESKSTGFVYSDDLNNILNFLFSPKNSHMKSDVILYHPTVLSYLETSDCFKDMNNILIDKTTATKSLSINDSNNALQVCKSIIILDESADLELSPVYVKSSPIYVNISPKFTNSREIRPKNVLSPTLAALALELPGYVPKQKPVLDQTVVKYKEPQQVSEKTLSNQWMSRLIALREREESLNRRERDLISKEIVSSPTTAISFIPANNDINDNTGITLPPMLKEIIGPVPNDEKQLVPKRNRRSSSVRTRHRRRKSCNYLDMDSSLSADAGDGSIVVTATKFSKENVPCRNIFQNNKKVHFTSVNPFVESDESVTLTFYELDNVDKDRIQPDKVSDDIKQFKYLDLEKMANEKRSAMNWNDTSPNKQAKITKNALSDVTNIKKAPSKASLTSKTSTSSHYSTASSQKSVTSNRSTASFQSCLPRSMLGGSMRQGPSTHQSLAPSLDKVEIKKPKGRMSLLPFKTPFKFSRRVD